MTNFYKLFGALGRCPIVAWRRVFEHSQWLKGFLLRAQLVISGHLTSESAIAAYMFAKSVVRLKRKSGLLFTALYLKQCSVSLQLYYGGVPQRKGRLPFPISLTRSGIPTIIPAFHRRIIRVKDDRADKVKKAILVMVWLGLSYKVVQKTDIFWEV